MESQSFASGSRVRAVRTAGGQHLHSRINCSFLATLPLRELVATCRKNGIRPNRFAMWASNQEWHGSRRRDGAEAAAGARELTLLIRAGHTKLRITVCWTAEDMSVGIYVQYGCGFSCPDGWLNFDSSPTLRLERLPIAGRLLRINEQRFPNAVSYGDIVKGLPVACGQASGAYASHVLEHLTFDDSKVALRNTYSLLAPGGIFRLVVPDLEARTRRYIADTDAGVDDANAKFLESCYLGSRGTSSLWARLRRTFGNSQHLWMWDERSMRSALSEAGFMQIRRCDFNDCEDPTFLAVEERSRFYDGGIRELAMEARRPR